MPKAKKKYRRYTIDTKQELEPRQPKEMSLDQRKKMFRLTAKLVEQVISESLKFIAVRLAEKAHESGKKKHREQAEALANSIATARKIVKMAAKHGR